jgi:predicted enzyme related to lactoylglutathione lyase
MLSLPAPALRSGARMRQASLAGPETEGVANSRGRFVWYELVTTDVAAATAFYTHVMGWGAWDASAPGKPYVLFGDGKSAISALTPLPDDARQMGAQPLWIGYVGVDDVDAAADRIARLGGAVHVPPTDVSDISRFSVFTDPQAARLALFKWRNPGPQPPIAPDAPGRVGWHELLAADWEQAWAFYAELFGWRKEDAGIRDAGTYQPFSAAGQTIGGMVTKPATIPDPFWLYYFNIDDIDAAAQRVAAGGGEVLEGPLETGGGSWVVRCADPQGAVFALEGMRSSPPGYSQRAAAQASGARGRWSW